MMIAYVLDDQWDCRRQLLERAGYRVLTYNVKDLIAEALVKPVLADMNQHGRGILWIRAIGPNTHDARHGYGTQTLAYMRLSNTFLALGGVVIVDGNLRSEAWTSEGLQQLEAHPDIRPTQHRLCNYYEPLEHYGPPTTTARLLTNLRLRDDNVCRCGAPAAAHRNSNKVAIDRMIMSTMLATLWPQ